MNNEHFIRFRQRLEHRYSRDYASMTNTEWSITNTTLKGKPFSVDRYPFQRAILDDMHPNMDVKKCSQIGLTEIQIRKALAFTIRNRGVSALFTLPDTKLLDKISQTRIQPLVESDRVFNSEMDKKSVRSKSIMQFGKSFLYVTGCTESDATSTSVDAIFNDEVDLSPQDILALFSSRLQGSDWRISQRFSTPSFPSYGIDLSYLSSDQRMYMVRCDACNHWNVPEFSRKFCTIPNLPDFIDKLTEIDETIVHDLDLPGSYVHCEKCQARLDLGRTDNREWVATYPGRVNARGYMVSPFSTNRLPLHYIINQLIDYKRRHNLRGFCNTVLGEAYSDGNIRLERDAILKCFTGHEAIPDVSKPKPVYIGIDVGQTCHLVLGHPLPDNGFHVFLFEAVPASKIEERVGELLNKYRIVGGTLDRHPYEPTADAIRNKSDGRILPVIYRGQNEIRFVKDLEDRVTNAVVNRTTQLDMVANYIKEGKLRFSGYSHYKETIIEHLRDMVRDEKPEEPATWVKLTGNDHFFHSIGFLLGATKVIPIRDLLYTDEIRTMSNVSIVTVKEDAHRLLDRKSNKLHKYPESLQVI